MQIIDRRLVRLILVLTSLIIFSVLPGHIAEAYQTSLDANAIESAYSLGQRNDKVTANFVADYLAQSAEQAPDGIHRADIELLTPFMQIVDRARDNSRGYSLQQAKDDYRTFGDKILIRVSLILPSNYPTSDGTGAAACDNTELQPQNFWNNFSFIVKQNGKVLTPRSVKNEPIYSAPSDGKPSRLDGANVSLEFDTKVVASEALIVDIVTPRCKNITATFDLAKLR